MNVNARAQAAAAPGRRSTRYYADGEFPATPSVQRLSLLLLQGPLPLERASPFPVDRVIRLAGDDVPPLLDYRCPFAKNIHLHVIEALRAGADFDVNFVPGR